MIASRRPWLYWAAFVSLSTACLMLYLLLQHNHRKWKRPDVSIKSSAHDTKISHLSNYTEFVLAMTDSLDAHPMSERPIHQIFSNNKSVPHPSCGGTWTEFGVHTGGTLTLAANYRLIQCGLGAAPIYGFDSFEGLPEEWWGSLKQGSFDMGGELPSVPNNADLVKGFFNDTLPIFLKEQDRLSKVGRMADVTYLHIDCDLYTGARDVLTLLNDRLATGCILLFDELVNYPVWRDHELKALWEWLAGGGANRRLQVIGMWGPLPGKNYSVELDARDDILLARQSAAFVVD